MRYILKTVYHMMNYYVYLTRECIQRRRCLNIKGMRNRLWGFTRFVQNRIEISPKPAIKKGPPMQRPQGKEQIYNYYVRSIFPHAIFSPEFPEGWDVKSSGEE